MTTHAELTEFATRVLSDLAVQCRLADQSFDSVLAEATVNHFVATNAKHRMEYADSLAAEYPVGFHVAIGGWKWGETWGGDAVRELFFDLVFADGRDKVEVRVGDYDGLRALVPDAVGGCLAEDIDSWLTTALGIDDEAAEYAGEYLRAVYDWFETFAVEASYPMRRHAADRACIELTSSLADAANRVTA